MSYVKCLPGPLRKTLVLPPTDEVEYQFEEAVKGRSTPYILKQLGLLGKRTVERFSQANRGYRIGLFTEAYHPTHSGAFGYTYNLTVEHISLYRHWIGANDAVALWEIALQIVATHGDLKSYEACTKYIGGIVTTGMDYLHTGALFRAAMRGHRALFNYIYDQATREAKVVSIGYASDIEFLRFIKNKWIHPDGTFTSNADIPTQDVVVREVDLITTVARVVCLRRNLELADFLSGPEVWPGRVDVFKNVLRVQAPSYGFVEYIKLIYPSVGVARSHINIEQCFRHELAIEVLEYICPEREIGRDACSSIVEKIVERSAWNALARLLDRGYRFEDMNSYTNLLRDMDHEYKPHISRGAWDAIVEARAMIEKILEAARQAGSETHP